MIFTFDHASHVYRVGVRRVPSVTGKIHAAGLHEGSDWYTPEARERGSRVHRATLDFDLYGEHGEREHEGYVDSYRHWLEVMRPKWVTLEQPRYSKRYKVAGTADRLGSIGGYQVIVDLKTGAREKWHPFQLALYDLIYDELPPGVRRRMGLYVKADGRIAQHIDYRDPSDYDQALAILAAT